MRDLEGRTAFITGGASGIGWGMARAFLDAGMKVVVADIDQNHLDEVAGQVRGSNALHLMRLDVADRRAVLAAADEVERVFGKVHLVCNNAGVGGGSAVADPEFDEWDWLMSINLGGVVNGVKAFVPKLKAHGEGGHIVNTSSMAGLIPLPNDGGAYTTSKFAVFGLTESLRLSLAPHNIGVSVLCPGLTNTRIGEGPSRAGRAPPQREGEPPPFAFDMALGMNPRELADAVVKGVKENAAYILPHGEFADEVKANFERVLAAFPTDQFATEGRLALEAQRRAMTEALRAAAERLGATAGSPPR